MRCYDCGGKYVKMFGKTTAVAEIYGEMKNDLEYYQCETCGELAFPRDSVVALEKQQKENFAQNILPHLKLR